MPPETARAAPVDPLAAERCLLVSPHLDDAVFSVGGLIAERARTGATTHVLTVFAGLPEPPFSPFAQRFHRACGLADDAVTVRRREDDEALAALGGVPLHGELLDAVYRRDAAGRWLYDGEGLTFSEPPGDDAATTGAVADLLEEVCAAQAPDLLLAPLGVGRHVDHLHVRTAALTVGAARGTPVLLWEDQPYRLQAEPDPEGEAVPVAVSPEAWERRLLAVGVYASQLWTLATASASWRVDLDRCCRSRDGNGGYVERLLLLPS